MKPAGLGPTGEAARAVVTNKKMAGYFSKTYKPAGRTPEALFTASVIM
jgi:hypothetical protein